MKSYIVNTRIYYPKPNQVYSVKDHTSREINVTFNLVRDQNIDDVIYIDISDFSFLSIDFSTPRKFRYVGFDKFIYPNTLPVNLDKTMLPSALFLPHGNNSLQSLSAMTILINRLNSCCDIKQMQYSSIEFPLPIHNKSILRECESMIHPGIKIIRFEYPIFIDEKKPSKEFLEIFLKGFLKYNKSQLASQWQLSEGYCTARAHALSILLNQYGITTHKVFKTWLNYNWGFHCAVMVVDADDKKWILDPWGSSPLQLLTINQWIKQKNEPMPRAFGIANSTVISNDALLNHTEVMGEFFFFPHFNENAPFLKALRTIYYLMTPSKLERPIAIKSLFKKNQLTLFSPKEAYSEASCSSRVLNIL